MDMQASIFYVVFDIFLLNPSDDAESYDHSALMLFFGGNPTLISIFDGLIYFLTFWDFVFFFPPTSARTCYYFDGPHSYMGKMVFWHGFGLQFSHG